MKTSVRFTRVSTDLYLEVIDLKYRDKVVAAVKITKDMARFLVKELAKEIE
jgi:hypothetical protein